MKSIELGTPKKAPSSIKDTPKNSAYKKLHKNLIQNFKKYERDALR